MLVSGVPSGTFFHYPRHSSCVHPSTKLNINRSGLHHYRLHGTKRFQGRHAMILPYLKANLHNGNYVSESSRQSVVLDIEGTTTPISFVTDVLFPYAHDNAQQHLLSTYESEETQDDIRLLRTQVLIDLEQGVSGSVRIPSENAGKEEIIKVLVTNIKSMIRDDRKITALKQLQGHIWRYGFLNNELKGVVFDDVPETLERWHKSGIKIYIYSSGSREAQRLIFGNTKFGDLRRYLCGFFDTTTEIKEKAKVTLKSHSPLEWMIHLKSYLSRMSIKKLWLQKKQVSK